MSTSNNQQRSRCLRSTQPRLDSRRATSILRRCKTGSAVLMKRSTECRGHSWIEWDSEERLNCRNVKTNERRLEVMHRVPSTTIESTASGIGRKKQGRLPMKLCLSVESRNTIDVHWPNVEIFSWSRKRRTWNRLFHLSYENSTRIDWMELKYIPRMVTSRPPLKLKDRSASLFDSVSRETNLAKLVVGWMSRTIGFGVIDTERSR